MANEVKGDPVFDPWIRASSGVFDRKVAGSVDIGEIAERDAGVVPTEARSEPHPVYGDQSKLAGHVIEINPETPEAARREAYSLVSDIGADRAFVAEMMARIDEVIDNERRWFDEGMAAAGARTGGSGGSGGSGGPGGYGGHGGSGGAV